MSSHKSRLIGVFILVIILPVILTACEIGDTTDDGVEEDGVITEYSEYEVEYYTDSTSAEKIWMPIPKNWVGRGINELEILDIEPEPKKVYTDEHGNEIAYWENESNEEKQYEIEFEVALSNINHNISENDYDIEYDQDSSIHQKYTSATDKTQSDAFAIKEKAEEIVGNTEDPMDKAEEIVKWTAANINYSDDVPYDMPDALSVLKHQKGGCGAFANIFVALSRAADIPARNVSLLHNPYYDEFQTGEHGDAFWAHIIVEFYLQDYGWVQVDPSKTDWFGNIEEEMIILTKGNEFKLRNSEPFTRDVWFHLPVRELDGYRSQIGTNMKVDKLD